MTDAETHRLIGELKGTLSTLARLVETIDGRYQVTSGEVAEMRAQIGALSRAVEALSAPVRAAALSDARVEGGEIAVADATRHRMEIIRTVTTVAGLVATLVSTMVGALVWLLTRNGGTQ